MAHCRSSNNGAHWPPPVHVFRHEVLLPEVFLDKDGVPLSGARLHVFVPSKSGSHGSDSGGHGGVSRQAQISRLSFTLAVDYCRHRGTLDRISVTFSSKILAPK